MAMAEVGGVDTSIYKAPDRPNMLQQAGQAVGVAQGMTAYQQQQFDLAKSHMDYWAPKLGSFAFDPRWKSGDTEGIRKDFVNTVADAQKLGMMTGGEAGVFLTQMPTDPNKFHDAMQHLWVQFQSAQTQMDALAAPMSQDTGGEVPYGTFNRLENKFTEAGRFKKTMTPEAAGEPTPMGVTPDLKPIVGTRQQFIGAAQGGGVAPAAAAAPDGGAAPVAPVAPVGPTPAPGGGIIAGPAPGEAEAKVATGKSAGEALARDRDIAGSFSARTLPLERAIPALEALGPQGVGPGSETYNEVMSFLQTNAPTIAQYVPGFDPTKITNFDEARKYLKQFAQAASDAVGPRTDQNLSTSLTGNPNVNISQLAAVDLAKAALALQRMAQAKILDFEDERAAGKVTDAQYGTWAAKWSTTHDPRAFAIDQMPQDQVAKLYDGLKGAERTKFVKSLELAQKYELIHMAGQ